ncbi:hypothetical protein CYMTET_5027 [Cymbomonas tetramitiformis]|uniref:Uncharacterized protein n=1 Tax=Cymbomonas tetramitiformis TaxID=36881 RepID=A0AAE0LJB2_9CHLO|nr:hypothetical protein CYMTET_5027 [Cymbomonas tetramitiformis]
MKATGGMLCPRRALAKCFAPTPAEPESPAFFWKSKGKMVTHGTRSVCGGPSEKGQCGHEGHGWNVVPETGTGQVFCADSGRAGAPGFLVEVKGQDEPESTGGAGEYRRSRRVPAEPESTGRAGEPGFSMEVERQGCAHDAWVIQFHKRSHVVAVTATGGSLCPRKAAVSCFETVPAEPGSPAFQWKSRGRIAVTPYMIARMYSVMNFKDDNMCTLWAAMLNALLCRLRKDNVCVGKVNAFNVRRVLRRREFEMNGDTMWVPLVFSKVIQFEERSHVVAMKATDGMLCPRRALARCFERTPAEPESPAFLWRSKGKMVPMTHLLIKLQGD